MGWIRKLDAVSTHATVFEKDLGAELTQNSGSGLTLLYGRHTHIGVIVVPLMLVGFGVGFIFQPTLVALQANVPKVRRAVIISNRNFFRCAGGAVGIAVSACVLQVVLRSHLPPSYAHLARNVYSLPKLQGDGEEEQQVLDAYMAGTHAMFLLQVPLMGLCLLGTFFVKDRGLEYPGDKEQQAAKSQDEGGSVEVAEAGVDVSSRPVPTDEEKAARGDGRLDNKAGQGQST